MADQTGIGWTDHTFNPWWGCEKISPGCAHCYADDLAARYQPDATLWGEGHAIRVASESYWKGPINWNRASGRDVTTGGGLGRRHRVFCLSMGDVFEERPDLEPHRRRLFDLIAATPWLDWQLLTKRPEFARDWLERYYRDYWYRVDHGDQPDLLPWSSRDGATWGVHPNLWVGVSIENARFTWRADVLREIPAPIRFISAEPLLGSLYKTASSRAGVDQLADSLDASEGRTAKTARDRAPLDLTGIDWVIVGGESGGRDARPMRPEWAREIRDAVLSVCGACDLSDGGEVCSDPRPAFYFKQWGSHDETGRYRGPAPTAGGKILDGREWCEFPTSESLLEQLALA